MSTDTKQLQEHYELQVQKYASVDLCKECYACTFSPTGWMNCMHEDPSPINCNVLKIHGNF